MVDTTAPHAAPPAPTAGDVVPLGPEDEAALLWNDQAAFVFPIDPDFQLDFIEWDRTFGVRVGEELAGTNTTFSLSVELPDGCERHPHRAHGRAQLGGGAPRATGGAACSRR